jgi:hypothetical protein
MNQVRSQSPDKVTVLVFKEHLAARAFHVPTQWIIKFGVLIGFLFLFSTVMSIFAIHYYRLASRPESINPSPAASTGLNAHSHSSQKTQDLGQDVNPQVPDQLETQALSPNSPDEADLSAENQSQPMLTNLFAGLASTGTPANIPDPSSLAFSIQKPRYSWHKNTLQVRFALQYTKQDRGSQQGRIVVLARGPSTLLSFPGETLNLAGITPLINYSKGEYFSVSRFREGTANFGPFASKDLIREIEILILSKSGDLLLHQSFPLKEPSSTAPKRSSATEDDS